MRRAHAAISTPRLAILAAILAAPLSLVAFASASSAAAAPNWKLTNLGLPQTTLFGISCPAELLCVGVGLGATIVSSTDPTGGAAAWRAVDLPGEHNAAHGNLRGVSCPTTTLCVAVNYGGSVLTSTDPTAGVGAWTETAIAGAKQLYGISCPSPSLCVAVGNGGRILTSTDPTGGAAAWSLSEQPELVATHSVSCVPAPLCVSVGGLDIAASVNPAAGAAAWELVGEMPLIDGSTTLYAVACSSPTLCVAANAGSVFVSDHPTRGLGAWVESRLPTRFQVLSIACPEVSLCAASTDNGEVAVSSDPTGGSSSWLVQQLIDGTVNGLYGLSCPTVSLCVAAGAGGQILTSTDPLGRRTPGAGRRAPLPRTILFGKRLRHLTTKPGHEKAGIRFHFTADGVFSGFECRLDRQSFRRCRAPRGYRLRRGSHLFKVRAVGPSGPDRTSVTARAVVSRSDSGIATASQRPIWRRSSRR